MKELMVFLITVTLFSCKQSSQPNSSLTNAEAAKSKQPIETFDWLIGKWKRLNDEEGRQTFENWQKESSSALLGHGFVMNHSDTIWQEQMVLSHEDSIWTLDINTPGNADVVTFKLVAYDSHSFTAENPMHDFPKRINYWKNAEKLSATVEGDSMQLRFDFAPIE